LSAPAPDSDVEIRPLRKALGLTQSQVAKPLRLSASYICHVERRVLVRPHVEARIRAWLLRQAKRRA